MILITFLNFFPNIPMGTCEETFLKYDKLVQFFGKKPWKLLTFGLKLNIQLLVGELPILYFFLKQKFYHLLWFLAKKLYKLIQL